MVPVTVPSVTFVCVLFMLVPFVVRCTHVASFAYTHRGYLVRRRQRRIPVPAFPAHRDVASHR